MKRCALLALLHCRSGVLPAFAGDEAPAPRDMVLLTVSGMIGNTNRGPLDPKRDSLLALQKADFKSAFAFDRAMLLALPQGSVTAQPTEFDKPATFKGPLLREVLGYVEAAKVKISFVAVDGYTGWLDARGHRFVRLDPRARGRRRAARAWAAGADLADQHARA